MTKTIRRFGYAPLQSTICNCNTSKSNRDAINKEPYVNANNQNRTIHL
jgi:hypothetical protein